MLSPTEKPQKDQAAVQGNQPEGYSGAGSADSVMNRSWDDASPALKDHWLGMVTFES